MARKDEQTSKQPADHPNAEEARRLAQEAAQEMKQGNKEEAEFVLNEAKSLDKEAVEQVLKRGDKGKH
jgi:hypothetical protein